MSKHDIAHKEDINQAQRRAKVDRQQSDFYHPNMEAEPETRGRRNSLSWHLKKPIEGPRHLAIKNHFIAMVGEYVGTTLFLLFALGGTNVANIPTTSVTGQTTSGQNGGEAATANTSNLLYIALCFGFSLAVNVWIFFRVSGGLFNPAVSLAMVLVGALEPLRGALLTVAQILGGITGAAIVAAITPGTLNVRTTLGGGTSIAQGLFMEMFLTSLLMLAILLLAAEKHKATFIAPIGIGLALFVAELLGVFYTGGSLNPARSFGPAVVLRTFEGYHWIYWLGPILGATLAAGFYKMLKWLQYETVLGPEHETRPTTPVGEKATAEPTMPIQGPGMDQYLTTGRGDLGEGNERLDARLDRIEAMLNQLLGEDPRLSTSTAVDVAAAPYSTSVPHQASNVGAADYARSTGAAATAPKLSERSQV